MLKLTEKKDRSSLQDCRHRVNLPIGQKQVYTLSVAKDAARDQKGGEGGNNCRERANSYSTARRAGLAHCTVYRYCAGVESTIANAMASAIGVRTYGTHLHECEILGVHSELSCGPFSKYICKKDNNKTTRPRQHHYLHDVLNY